MQSNGSARHCVQVFLVTLLLVLPCTRPAGVQTLQEPPSVLQPRAQFAVYTSVGIAEGLLLLNDLYSPDSVKVSTATFFRYDESQKSWHSVHMKTLPRTETTFLLGSLFYQHGNDYYLVGTLFPEPPVRVQFLLDAEVFQQSKIDVTFALNPIKASVPTLPVQIFQVLDTKLDAYGHSWQSSLCLIPNPSDKTVTRRPYRVFLVIKEKGRIVHQTLLPKSLGDQLRHQQGVVPIRVTEKSEWIGDRFVKRLQFTLEH